VSDQTLQRLVVADRAGFAVAQHRIQLVELQLLHVQVAQEISGKGTQLLGGFDQPAQHGVRIDLEDPSGGTDAQPLGEARQGTHDEVHWDPLTMENRAVRLEKIALTSRTVQLPPGAPTGMAVGTQVPEPQPAAIGTTRMGTKMHGGVNHTRASLGWRHGSGAERRGRLGMRHLVFTGGTEGFVR
jgi:hypothetical protein